jgi:hypothetical protein
MFVNAKIALIALSAASAFTMLYVGAYQVRAFEHMSRPLLKHGSLRLFDAPSFWLTARVAYSGVLNRSEFSLTWNATFLAITPEATANAPRHATSYDVPFTDLPTVQNAVTV